MINTWDDIYWAEITDEEREELDAEALEDAAAWAEAQRDVLRQAAEKGIQ